MAVQGEFAVRLVFDKHEDGRYHIYSPNVPGLHLAGTNLEALRRDVEPVVKDLLLYNKKLVVDHVRWVPSLDSVMAGLTDSAKEPALEAMDVTYLVSVKSAA